MKTPSISEIAEQVINEVRTEQLIKHAAVKTINETTAAETYQTQLGYRLKKLAGMLRKHINNTDVNVADVYKFVEHYGKETGK